MPELDFEETDRPSLPKDDLAYKLYQRQLQAHPDCGDPDHPGCRDCDNEHEDMRNETEE